MAPGRRITDTGIVRLLKPSEIANELVYLVVAFPLGLLWFCLFVTLLATTVGLMPILIGVFLLAATLRLAGACAGFERRLVADWLGRIIDGPERHTALTISGERRVWSMLAPIGDGSYWRELVYLLLRLFLGIGSLVLLMVLGTIPLAGVASVIEAMPGVSIGFQGGAIPVVIWVAAGVVALALGPTILWAYAHLHGVIAHYLLGPSTASLTRRAEQAETSRDLSITAAEAERQRIERDLHDGAQARLSTVALDLGRAKRKLEQGADPEEVAAVIDHAHADAKAAIVELRNLARGIHPAVLTDRGLDAALSEVAARAQIPISLHIDLPLRPSAATESAAYFAVSELLNNVARHASARQAWVTVAGRGDIVTVEVGDDGVGGVDTALGTGVAGLQQRVESLGGTLSVDSPLGGGTTATIELPMTSGLASSNGESEPNDNHPSDTDNRPSR